MLAAYIAAFMSPDFDDETAFLARLRRILEGNDVIARTILADGRVAGHVASFLDSGRREVTFWLGRAFWGRGTATITLSLYLEIVSQRPLHTWVATDNIASRRVLEKCGFAVVGEGRGSHMHARKKWMSSW
jgi:RimJ/RimL family protein N-acetyltransferase